MPISKDEIKIGTFVKIGDYNCYKYGRIKYISKDREYVSVKSYICKQSKSCEYYPCKGESSLWIKHIDRVLTEKEKEKLMVELL